MRFKEGIALKQLLLLIDYQQVIGSQEDFVLGLNEIHKIEQGDLSFVDNSKYYKKMLASAAKFIIIDSIPKETTDKTLIICQHPFEAYNTLVGHFRPTIPLTQNRGDYCEIDPTAIIEPNVIIGHHVKIGAHCHIQVNCYIGSHTVIGDHVNIQAGTVIGTDAFYYKKINDQYTKWTSGGRVVIHDHVEIGACATINKGVSGDTVIGKGTKLDSQVHLGHGVVIGENCLLAGQVGIGGKTIVGDRVIMYGQVGVAQSLLIESDTVILAKSGVSKNLKGGKTYFGYPAGEVTTKYKELATLRILSRRK